MRVEVWSDVACPWCAVGKRRLDKALAELPPRRRDGVRVRWRSFELDPGAPRVRAVSATEHLAGKYGTTHEHALRMQRQLTETAAAEGLEFHLERARGGNTFDAHRLLHLAAEHGLQSELKERLLTAYHGEGRALGEPDTLHELAVEVGLPAADVRGVLDGDAYADAVRADERQAARYGIDAVPFFVLDGRLGLAGAQPTEVLRAALDEAFSAGQTPVRPR